MSVLASAAAIFVAGHSKAQIATGWNGAGADNNWSTATNWDNTGPAAGARDLFFGNAWLAAGTGTTTAQNDIGNYQGHKIVFENIASPVTFVLQGNAIMLFDFGGASPVFPQIQNNSTANQILSIPVAFNDTSGNNKAEINPINGNLQFDNAVDLAGANTQLQIWGNNGKTVTFNAPITSSGHGGANSLALNQNSNVIFRAANTYTGDTFVNAGHLQFDVGGSLTSTIRLGDTTSSTNAAIDLLTAAGGLTLDRTINPRAGSTGNTLSFNSQNTSGVNTYSGHVGLDHDFTVTQATGGELDVTQLRATPTDTTTGFDIKGFAATFTSFPSSTIHVSGTIYNSVASGSVLQNGSGTLILSGDNTYTGTTTVNGTLQLGAGTNTGSIDPASAITGQNVGATLAFNHANTLTVTNTLTSLSLVQRGTGTTILAGSNVSGVSTLVASGTLQVGAGTTSGNLGSGSITDNANLAFNRSDTVTPASIGGSGNVIQNGSGTLVLAGEHGYSGHTVANNGTIRFTATAAISTAEIEDSATIEQLGGTVNATGPDSLRLAPGVGQNGTYSIAGGTLNAQGLGFNGSIRVGEGGAGTLLIGGDAQVNAAGAFSVGVSTGAAGVVEQTGGNVVTGGSAFVGRGAGATGQYSISSGGCTIHGNLQVGFAGAGTFVQNGGIVVVNAGPDAGLLIIGNGAGAIGQYDMNFGSLGVADGIVVGGDVGAAGGAGTLTVNGGIATAAHGMTVWQDGTVNLNLGGILNIGTTPADNIQNNGTIVNNGGTLNLAGKIYGAGTITNASGNVTFSDGSDVGTQDVRISGGTAVDNGTLTVGRNAGSIGILNISGGSTTINGVLGVGNNGTLGAGAATAQGHVNVSAGSLYADTIVLGNTTGGSGDMTISGTGNVTVGGGLLPNDLNVNGGTLTVLDQVPPTGEDPVLNRSIAAGYTRDGAMNVTAGVVTSPNIKLGVTFGNVGTVTQSGGVVNVGVLGVGNNGTLTDGAGTGHYVISAGSLNADTVVLGSTTGGSGDMTVSGTASVTVGGGFSANTLNVTGGSVTVLDQNPPAGEDPVLNRSIIGGYLRDGALNVSGGVVTSPNIKLGITAGKTGTYVQTGGSVNAGYFGAGNDGTLTAGAGIGSVSISGGTLTADTIVLGSTTGGSGDMAVSGTGHVIVGGGIMFNDLNINGGTLEVLNVAPPAGEDPVLDRAIVGGYLRDGAMHVTNGVVTTPYMKLGVSSGNTGTFTQSGGDVSVGTLLIGSDAGGIGALSADGGELRVEHLLIATPTGSMAIGASGKINLTQASAVIDYTGASPLSAILSALVSGYSAGAWTGNGIDSSAAASVAADGAELHKTAIGYADNAHLGLTDFATQSGLDATAILLRYTYYGDANLDASVDSVDFNLLASNFSGTSRTWDQGDFNFDGAVDSVDFNLLASNFGQTLSAPAAVGARVGSSVGSNVGAPVPEPAMLGVVLAGAGLLRRRSRR
jgi:autotransporter-associated beta strand protein